MNFSHILVAVLFILIGVVFAGWFRSLPLVSSLPAY
jgi:hypothetical protein